MAEDSLWKHPDRLARLVQLPEKLELSMQTRQQLERHVFPQRWEHAAKPLQISHLSCEQQLAIKTSEKAPWSELEPIWQRWLQKDPSPKLAARMCESAYLHAKESTWGAVCHTFVASQPLFYSELHPHVRQAMLTYSQRDEVLQEYVLGHLLRSRQADWLSSLERVAVFAALYKSADPQLPWNFYCQWSNTLLPLPEDSYLSEDLLRIMIGRLAMRVGEVVQAREMLQLIRPDQRYGQMAQELIAKLPGDSNQAYDAKWREWVELGNWKQKIIGLQAWLEEARDVMGLRGFLTQLLPDLGQYFEKDPVVWNELTQMLLQSGAEDYLDVFAFHRTQERVVHDAAMEFALWRPLMTEDVPARWHGIALLHDFLASFGERTESLWHGMQLLQRHDAVLWKESYRWALHWSQTESMSTETQKAKMKQYLSGLAFEDHRDPSQLEGLLRSQKLSRVMLYGVLQSVQESQLDGFQTVTALVIRQLGFQQPLENERLELLWHTLFRQDPGVAWRIATVLASREQLSKKAYPFWLSSGEKRDRYPVLTPAATHVDRCFAGLSVQNTRLIWSLFRVGPMLPELLACVSSEHKVQKKKKNERQQHFAQHLSQMKWLGEPKVHVASSLIEEQDGRPIPGFCKSLAPGLWTEMCAYVSDRLGLNHWNWNLTLLKNLLDPLLSHGLDGVRGRSKDPRLTKWLRGLSSEQKAAWQDLLSLMRKVEDKEGAMALAVFVVRLTTLIYPAHYEALSSLRKMQAPSDVLWGLEGWLVSEEYHQTRVEQGLETHCPIPESLQRVSVGYEL